MRKEEEIEKHPSFANIQFSRISGNSGYLFGSQIQSNNYIQLEIREAEKIRDLCEDKHYHGRTICRVKMSAAQFSELITTLNYNIGTPCTLEQINGNIVPQVNSNEVESRKSFVNRKIKERMKEFSDQLTETQEKAKKLVGKNTLSKEDRRQLLFAIDFMKTELIENIPFFIKCFQETMDEIIVDAKAEIDNSIQQTITQACIEALNNYQKPAIQEIND